MLQQPRVKLTISTEKLSKTQMDLVKIKGQAVVARQANRLKAMINHYLNPKQRPKHPFIQAPPEQVNLVEAEISKNKIKITEIKIKRP